jgi:hypothetical protein
MKDTLSLIEPYSYELFPINFRRLGLGFEIPEEFITIYDLLLELANKKYPILKSKLEEII